MKACPHCRHELTFGRFLTGYGSDTLFKHPAQAHPHEHLCLNCHRMVWVHYDKDLFDSRVRQALVLHLVFSAVMTYFGVKPALHFSQLEAVLFMVMVMLFGGVIIRFYARYQSAALKADKV